MKAYVKRTDNNSLFEQARCGLIFLGYEVVYYKDVPKNIESDAIVVGFIGDIVEVANNQGYILKQIDYPEKLKKYLYRNITRTHTKNLKLEFPFFIKPTNIKSFAGRVVNEFKDLIGVKDEELYFTKGIYNIVSEYRCYILNGQIIGVKHYKGDPYLSLEESLVQEMVSEYTDCPNAYSMDIGITECGKNILIECNSGYSTGNYGLSDVHYAKFLIRGYEDIKNGNN